MTASPIGNPNRLDANPGDRNLLTDRIGAALDANVLPSSASTWLLSQMVNVKPIRKLLVELQYDSTAPSTTLAPPVTCSWPSCAAPRTWTWTACARSTG